MRIILCGDTPLVFDLSDVLLLRQHGVIGVLSGTLPTLSQQNSFASIPLRLMPEEALWLVREAPLDVELVPSGQPWFTQDQTTALSFSSDSFKATRASLAAQRVQRRAQQARKLQERGLPAPTVPTEQEKRLLDAALFVHTADTPSLPDQEAMPPASPAPPLQLACTESHYTLYKTLREQGYVVSPGGRFGGKYVVYPGDPLRFHSHIVVSEPLAADEPLDFLHVVAEARLATTVKKIWVASAVDQEESARFYSVEWAGFG